MRIFSGHGPQTTIAHEKKYNPFLLPLLILPQVVMSVYMHPIQKELFFTIPPLSGFIIRRQGRIWVPKEYYWMKNLK
jgi:hypothetical protein